MKTAITFLLLVGWSASLAQTQWKLSGQVVDAETSDPLGYVSISLVGKPLGTVTNTDGSFDFYIASQNSLDTLLVSMLGYTQHKSLIKDLMVNEHLIIRMKSKPTLLNEVVIVDKKLTGRELIKLAFSKVEENFPLEPYMMKAFFRESYEENDKTVFLVDAVVDIEDDEGFRGHYKKPNLFREKMRLQNVRVSNKYFKSVFEIDNFSYLTYCLKWRNIKYREPDVEKAFAPHSYEKTKIVCEEKYSVDSVVYIDSHAFYVVNYLHTVKDSQMGDTYYIDAESFAIKKHIVHDIAKEGTILNEWKFKDKGPYVYQNLRRDVTQEYEYYHGKMYLKYVKGEFLAGIFNETTKTTEFLLKTREILVVTEIQTSDFVPILKTIEPSHNLSAFADTYDPEFWKNYEKAKLFPLTKKQRKDLEWEISLDNQFKK